MVGISNILKTRDGKNGVWISANIESEDYIIIGADSSSITLTSDDRCTVAKYTDKLLRSIHKLYGAPVIKCKYDTYNLVNFGAVTAIIYIEEGSNI